MASPGVSLVVAIVLTLPVVTLPDKLDTNADWRERDHHLSARFGDAWPSGALLTRTLPAWLYCR